jgi:hypothetical protein
VTPEHSPIVDTSVLISVERQSLVDPAALESFPDELLISAVTLGDGWSACTLQTTLPGGGCAENSSIGSWGWPR